MPADRLKEMTEFSGAIRLESDAYQIKFCARINGRGEIELNLEEIPVTTETAFIFKWHDTNRVILFRLEGNSPDGIAFSTDRLFFQSIGPKSDATGTRFDFKCLCTFGKFRWRAAAKQVRGLQKSLRGFACFGRLEAESKYGIVYLGGASGDSEVLSGALTIIPPDAVSDLQSWRDEAEKLIEHVLWIMSMASGARIDAPVSLYVDSEAEEITVSNHIFAGPGEMPVFHPLNRGPIFEVAVRSFNNLAYPLKGIDAALEWLVMKPYYNEMRLLCAMTALENLVSTNSEWKATLSDKKFARLKHRLKSVVEELVEDIGLDMDNKDAVIDKLVELKRPPFRRKLYKFLEKLDVPLEDIGCANIDAAISARNDIVHEGIYYKDGATRPELWGHVTAIREIVCRILFRVIGFSGEYISYYGGYHFASFPATLELQTDAVAEQ